MKFLTTGFLLLAFIVCSGLCWDDERAPCELHDEFSADFHSLKMDEKFCLTKVNIGSLRYDYTHQKMRVDYMKKILQPKKFERFANKEDFVNGTIFYDFTQGKGYHYSRDNETCKSFALKAKMTPPTIPETADFLGSSMIGSQSIETWHISSDDGGKKGKKNWAAVVSLTEGSCFPLSIMVYDKDAETVKYSTQFWNVVPSVLPFSFELPQICKQEEIEDPFLALDEKDLGLLGANF